MRSINGDEAGGGGGAGAGGGKEEKINVSVRVRPLNSKEIERNDHSDWEVINNTTIIFKNNLPDRSMQPSAYTYDRVFGCNCDTRKVYEEGAKEVALSVVSGINSSIFAYGQTSSGKTYTMRGITEYFVEDIYDYMEKHEERKFILKFSAMEIYNEAVRDLLSSDSTHLRLLDDPERGTVVEKLIEETLTNKSHLKELLAICEAQRQIGETYLNEASSRSHQILRLTVESSAKQFQASSLAATVSFVDLAGSERASQTLSAGTRLKEGSHINRSLLTLGTVIRKLSKGRNAHVPYRDSKLTRILHNSLGGNARTSIICTMSPARSHIEQSRNTLLFASCAKEVSTSARVNVVMSDKALVKHLQRELARLEDELRYVGSINKTTDADELKEKDAQIRKMGKEIMLLIQQRDLAQSRLGDLLSTIGDDQASRRSEDFGRLSIQHARNPSDDLHSSRHWEESSQISVQHTSNAQAFRQWIESNKPCAYRAGNSEDESSISEASGICYQSPEFGISKCRIPHLNDNYDANLLPSVSENASYIPHYTHQVSEIEVSEEHSIDANANDDHESNLKHPVRVRQSGRNVVKPDDVESIRWSGLETDSFGLQNFEEDDAPPYDSVKNFLARPVDDRAGNSSVSCGTEAEIPFKMFKKSDVSSDEELNFRHVEDRDELHKARHGRNCDDKQRGRHYRVASEVAIPNISNFVEGMKEMAEVQYKKRLTKNGDLNHTSVENSKAERSLIEANVDPLSSSSESSSPWQSEFEKLQREMIELWDACNVSLIHRTYFFLLFNGDPADSIYIEVERRRLSFLKKVISQESGKETLSSSMKNLRRERDILHKRMLKKLSPKEREDLYRKWGIELSSKQRRMQLSRQLWADTIDIERIRESALLVAKLVGLLEPDRANKEMFGLSFSPRKTHRRSSSWKHISSFK